MTTKDDMRIDLDALRSQIVSEIMKEFVQHHKAHGTSKYFNFHQSMGVTEHVANSVFNKLAQRGLINSGWMPIESAPRDGTRMIVFCPTENDQYVINIAHWQSNTEKWHNGLWGVLYEPTHWMPLPAAPKMDGKE